VTQLQIQYALTSTTVSSAFAILPNNKKRRSNNLGGGNTALFVYINITRGIK
jgi:hypothetical protein